MAAFFTQRRQVKKDAKNIFNAVDCKFLIVLNRISFETQSKTQRPFAGLRKGPQTCLRPSPPEADMAAGDRLAGYYDDYD